MIKGLYYKIIHFSINSIVIFFASFEMDPIRTYFRQSEAIEDAEASSCFTFSWETNLGGRRKYFVSKLEDFWKNYIQRTSSDRKVYEVIPPSLPSKLYLDLEYMKAENISKDGDAMLKILIDETSVLLKTMFDHQVCQEDILILEATTNSKFSLHVIFTETIFEDNTSVGDFVKLLVSVLNEKHPGMFMVTNKSRLTNFVDTSVYKSRQNFRVYLSRKLGKSNTLHLSDAANDSWNFRTDEDIFKASLISNVTEKKRVISYKETKSVNVSATPSVKVNSTLGKYKSPYHEIENMIAAKVYPGFIRDCIYQPSRLIFPISGNRYCDNVKREHTRNNIYYIVRLEDLTFTQACHSCSGFRGEPNIIPPSLISWIEDTEASESGD